MSSHSGTIGRSNGRSISGNGTHMRRQRSVEWHHAQGYSSSDDDERGIHGTINPSFDSQLLAQLIAQSQELSNKCKCSATIKCIHLIFAYICILHLQIFYMIYYYYY